MYTEGIVTIPVYFCSRWNIVSTNIRSVLLYCRYNKTFEQIQFIFIIIIYAIKNKLSLCKLFSSLLPYIFVLDSIFLFQKNMYTEGIVMIPVHFCSRWNIVSTDIRSVLLYRRYNKTFEQIQYIFIIIIYAIKNKLSLCNNIIVSE